MADLDTRSKRASSVGFLRHYSASLVLPDGTLGQGDRQHAVGNYSGILAVEATSQAVGIYPSEKKRKYKRQFTIPLHEEQEQEQRLIQGKRLARKAKQERPSETQTLEGIDLSAEIKAIEAHLQNQEAARKRLLDNANIALIESRVILGEAQLALDEEEFIMLMLMAA